MAPLVESRSETQPAAPTKESGPHGVRFERLEKLAQDPPWVRSARQAAFARFGALGFPTLHDEDWRFTNVALIGKLPFRPVFELARDGLTAESLNRFAFTGLKGSRLVFINGHFAPGLSSVPAQTEGVRVSSLREELVRDPTLVEPHLFRSAGDDTNAFTALNTAFFLDGAFIFVPAGKAVADPVHLLFVATGKESGTTSHPRNLIVAERGSRLTVIESYVSLTDAACLTNTLTELVVGDHAGVEHLKFQDEGVQSFHVGHLAARFGRSSNVISHSFALGARLSRTGIRAHLAGPDLECVLNGLYLTKGEQLADHHMVVEHAQPHCASHEYFNGILDDQSKGVFHGRILVQPAAQKTDAKQTNKNLLLSDDATVDSKPQLEIYADDVKCTHGATVGQMDEDSIFYLRSRGIGLETARRMLMHAFAGEIIDRVRCVAAREELDRLVWHRLEQNPHLAAVGR
jgi:Fe-S cluster assembly protein SufD